MQQLLVRYSQEVGKYVAFIGAGVIFYHAQSFFRVGVRLFKYNVFGCVMVYGCVVYLLFYMFLFFLFMSVFLSETSFLHAVGCLKRRAFMLWRMLCSYGACVLVVVVLW